VLLAAYGFAGIAPDWSKVVYRPRQFAAGAVVNDPSWGSKRVDNAGSYAGWDLFPTPNDGIMRIAQRADWLTVALNRAATLAVVWRAGTPLPGWLGGWTRADDVTISGTAYPTYRKAFAAGSAVLGGVYNPTDSPSAGRDTYWVLLAEADAKPSPAPSVPSGQATPQPNQTCPAWVHDRFATTGPDGGSYPTWHPAIDPVYWCYHRHEHGSNPAPFGAKLAYGFTATRHGMVEPHAGFKSYLFDDWNGHTWLITHHFGTAGKAQVCNRFHTFDVLVKDRASGELLVDYHFMADFGYAIDNDGVPYTPVDCPTQYQDAAASTGARMVPRVGGVNYEPWRPDHAPVLGIRGTFTPNTRDQMVHCNDLTCSSVVPTGMSGTDRFVSFSSDYRITAPAAAASSGEYWTDPLASKVVSAGTAGAIRQWIKPGVVVEPRVANAANTAGCYDRDAWGRPYICADTIADNPTNREASIQAPN
jgi:hypothetical protein